MGFSTVREKIKGINEILMRKSACSNFTGNDYFLDLTTLNSFVFGMMHLQGVHLRAVNDALQATVMTVLGKKHGLMYRRLYLASPCPPKSKGEISDLLCPLAASNITIQLFQYLESPTLLLQSWS